MSLFSTFKQRTGKRLRRIINNRLLALLTFKYGHPDYILSFRGGLGDQLLCTIPINHLVANGKKVWFVTEHPELFENNKDIAFVLSYDLAKKLKVAVKNVSYLLPPVNNKEVIPQHHIVKLLCNNLGVRNTEIRLKPVFKLSKEEINKGSIYTGKIVLSTSGMSAKYPMITKDWFPGYYQEVVDTLSHKYSFVQIGSVSDPLLNNVTDLRGKLTVRESASALKNAALYLGQVGFLMHLARAVDCVSVIIFGGRERPDQSGYSCNENFYTALECSPCWSYTCDIDRLCMKNIKPAVVAEAINKTIEFRQQTKEEYLWV